MKSLVIFIVEHGETTDPLDNLVAVAGDTADVIDWTCRIGIPNADIDYTFRYYSNVGGQPMIAGRRNADTPA